MRPAKTIIGLGLFVALACLAQAPYHNSLVWRANQWLASSSGTPVPDLFWIVSTDAPAAYLTTLSSRVGSAALTNADAGSAATNAPGYAGNLAYFDGSKQAFFDGLTVSPSNSFSIWLIAQPGTDYLNDDRTAITLKRGLTGTAEYLRWRNANCWEYGESTGGNISGTNQGQWMAGTMLLIRSNNAGAVTVYGSANGEALVTGFTTSLNPSSNIVFTVFGGASSSLQGYLCEMRVYGRVLNAAEINSLSNYSRRYELPWATNSFVRSYLHPTNYAGSDGAKSNLWVDLSRYSGHAAMATNAGMQPYMTNFATSPMLVFGGAHGMVITNGTVNSAFIGAFGYTILAELRSYNFTATGMAGYLPKSEGSMRAGIFMPLTGGNSEIAFGGRRLDADSYVGSNTVVVAGVKYAVMATFDFYHNTATLWTNGVIAAFISPFQGTGASTGSTIPISLGYANSQFGQQFFNGQIGRSIFVSEPFFEVEAKRFYREMQGQ